MSWLKWFRSKKSEKTPAFGIRSEFNGDIDGESISPINYFFNKEYYKYLKKTVVNRYGAPTQTTLYVSVLSQLSVSCGFQLDWNNRSRCEAPKVGDVVVESGVLAITIEWVKLSEYYTVCTNLYHFCIIYNIVLRMIMITTASMTTRTIAGCCVVLCVTHSFTHLLY